MSIWKDLTSPDSFAGEYDTVTEAPADAAPLPRFKAPTSRLDRNESVIASGVVIEGKIDGRGDLCMAGNLNGNIHLKGNLSVEPGARIAGAVQADTVTLGGAIDGNIDASNHMTLLETGQLVGDLKAGFVTVAAGARMRGKVEFGWDKPVAKSAENQKSNEKSDPNPLV